MYYAVKNGRKNGIYESWLECKEQVAGVKNAKFKGFNSIEEAEAWMKTHIPNPNRLRPDETKTDYVIFTDGSCLKNPAGPGGYAGVLIHTETQVVLKICGGSPSTTNNRMEMMATIESLKMLGDADSATVYTDSKYIQRAFKEHWLRNWKKNGWKTSTGNDVLNKDLWLQLDELTQKHYVNFQWVKGHAGNKYNEMCDKMAKGEAKKFSSK